MQKIGMGFYYAIGALRAVSPGMPLQQVDLLCYISQNPQTTQSEIVQWVEMTQGAASRNLRTLRELGLVDVRISFDDPRARQYSLTHAGKQLIRKINYFTGVKNE